MTEDFDEFDDFDADISNAAEAEAQEEEEQPVVPTRKASGTPTRKSAPLAPAPAPVQQQAQPQQRRQRQASGVAQPQQNRFEAYTTSRKYGVMDNATGKAYMEADDPVNLVLGLIVEMKNDLEEIKESL